MVKCPNKNHPEWKELERLLPNMAYVVWDAFPEGVDKAPNGADSKLFKDLLEHYNGDRDSAIRAKAKTVTDAFKTWFGDSKVVDVNGEPLMVWHGTANEFTEFELDIDNKRGKHLVHVNNGFFFTDSKEKALMYKHTNAMPVFLSAVTPGMSSVIEDNVVDNVSKENEILLNNIYDSAIFVRFDKEGDNRGATPTTQYVVKNPNQIKSIDNVGDFSTSANIYYKLMNNIETARTEIYSTSRGVSDPEFYQKMKSFTDSSSAIDYLLKSGLVTPNLRHLAELLMKHSTKLRVLSVQSKDKTMATYDTGTREIVIYENAFRESPKEFVSTLLHEVLHHYLGDRYENSPEYRKQIDLLHNRYKSLLGKDGRNLYGLYASGEEFVNEILSNPIFASKLKAAESTLFQRIKRTIAKAVRALGINTASANTVEDIVKGLTEMVEHIAKVDVIPDDNDVAVSKIKLKAEDTRALREIARNSKRVEENIMRGIKSRIKSLQQFGNITLNKTMQLEQELAKLQEMFDKNEDKQAMVEFITHMSIEASRPLKVVNAAYAEYKKDGKFSLRNDQLVQLQKDFIGFYEPILNDINLKLYHLGYFDDLDATDLAFVKNQISLINSAISVLKAKYNSLLAQRFGEILIAHGDRYQSDTIRTYVDDNVNTTNTDLNFYFTFIGGMRFAKDEALRIIAKRVTDTQNAVMRTTVNKASEILPVFVKVKNWQQFYELDEKGKKTGYLVRDRNYGRFNRDYNAFLDTIGEAPSGDDQLLREWHTKRTKWLAEHAERRYKPEYYDLFNNLGFSAKNARDSVQLEISLLLSEHTDKSGVVHLEAMPDDSWNKLQGLYEQKRRLANKFYEDGSKKSGIDLEIAEQLNAVNKTLSEVLNYKSDLVKFNAAAKVKRDSLSPDMYRKWYDRSTRIAYSEEFQLQLKSLEKRYYNEEYARLADDRRDLIGLYRNTQDFAVDTTKMPQSVKDLIKDLDKQMRDIASTFPKESSEFSKLAHIENSNYYIKEKAAAAKQDKTEPGFYRAWSNANHYTDNRGVLRPHSYFNLMLPNNKKDVEIVPSREYSEVDPTSTYWNNDFDANSPESSQPKKSLYDNQVAYDKVMADENASAMYNTIVDTMSESNDKISFMKRKNSYKLPQISGGLWAHMTAGDSMVAGIGKYMKDSTSIRPDDVDYNLESLNRAPDGSKLDTIPVHYVKMLEDPSTMTNNLGGAIIKYFEMAENFQQKQAMLPELQLLQDQINKREYAPEYAGTTEARVDAVRRWRISTKVGTDTNTAKRLKQYYNNNIFGNQYNPLTVGKFNLSKTMVLLKSYTTLVNLGLSPFVAWANAAGGLHQHITEALVGSFYTPKCAALAFKESVVNTAKIIFNGGRYTHGNKVLSMMNHNQVSRSTTDMYDNLNYNRFARFVKKHLFYGMMSAGDFVVKSQIMMSVYFNTKFVPGEGFMTREEYIRKHAVDDDKKEVKRKFDSYSTPTLWDVYDASGTTVKIKDGYSEYAEYVTPELENKMANIVQFLTQRADGMVDQSEKNFAHANVLTGFVIMHKSFLITAVEDRILKPTAYNYMTERMDEAQYKSAYLMIMNTVSYLMDLRKYKALDKADRGDRPTRKKLEDFQKYNIKRIGAETSLIIAYLLISMMLRNWDDDEDTWSSNAVLYGHERFTYEAMNLYNPWDIVRSFKTVSPAMSSFENMKTVASIVWVPGWEDITKKTKYGAYKGMSKWEKAVFKSTPLKNLIEATDPKQKYKYLKGQLD